MSEGGWPWRARGVRVAFGIACLAGMGLALPVAPPRLPYTRDLLPAGALEEFLPGRSGPLASPRPTPACARLDDTSTGSVYATGTWDRALRRQGDPALVARGQAWRDGFTYRPRPWLAVGLGTAGEAGRLAYADTSAAAFAYARSDRYATGALALAMDHESWGIDFALSGDGSRDPGAEAALRLRRTGLGDLEYAMARGGERWGVDARVSGPDGTQAVAGEYHTRYLSQRLSADWAPGPGRVSAWAWYRASRPGAVAGEYWLCDSARTLRAGLEAAWDPGPWACSAWLSLGEGLGYSFGRRVASPPSASDFKYFHYAPVRSYARELGFACASRRPGWSPRLALVARDFTGRSRPVPQAMDARRETLNYNRLGLSDLAGVVGALYQDAEIAGGRAWIGGLEAEPSAEYARGPWRLRAGVPLELLGADLSASGAEWTRHWDGDRRGHGYSPGLFAALLAAGPGLELSRDIGRLRLEGSVTQIIPWPLGMDPVTPETPGSGGGERWPWGGNGLALGMGLSWRL